jgi:endonuclease/exonuclease/phosphatase family metal-dependent hydrolase
MQFITSGHLLLSRYPIRRHHWQYFKHQATIEQFLCSRGSIYAELTLPDGSPLHVSSCHTTSGTDVLVEAMHLQHTRLHRGGNPTALQEVREWAEQVKCQLAASSPHASRSTLTKARPAVIMCGDLNITPHDHEYKGACAALDELGLGLRDTFEDRWEPTFGMSQQQERLLTQAADVDAQKTVDYIFSAASPVEVKVEALAAEEAAVHDNDKYQQVSDHRAVVASWAWEA